jgi:hypothetical protein
MWYFINTKRVEKVYQIFAKLKGGASFNDLEKRE